MMGFMIMEVRKVRLEFSRCCGLWDIIGMMLVVVIREEIV
jgi:hypothetical protein